MTTSQRLYVHLTTLAIIVLNGSLIMVMGFTSWLKIQIPVIFLASVAGVWLFYVQHQYSDVTWKRSKDWNYRDIALQGSSFYKLPRILQWFSGNIGFHHIHHLGPESPIITWRNAITSHKDIWNVKPLSFMESLGSLATQALG
jgi:acyl-lipid omega-6 desaturase (Delta-12 desaturase)